MLPLSLSVWFALPVGMAFGAILERAGLGNARVISRQLSFEDFTVVKVMFSAIVTAMLALFWADQLGWLELSRVSLPETDVIPQLIGALIFGIGFAMASLCPGTACVSAASGRRDGLAAIAGIAFGSIVTAEAWPALGRIATNAPQSDATLPIDLGMSPGVVVLAISALAVGAFVVAERVENAGASARSHVLRFVSTRPILLAMTLAVLAAMQRERGGSSKSLAAIAGEISREGDHVDPIILADWIRERRAHVRVVEVVESISAVDPGAYVIPGSETVALVDVPDISVSSSDTLVLYSAGGTHAAQAWVLLRARNAGRSQHIYVLRDGLAAWEDEVMLPTPPLDSSATSLERYHHARELQQWFGGAVQDQGNVWSTPAPVPQNGKPARRRRNTC